MSQISAPTIIAFLIYVSIVLAIGFYAYVRTKSAGDYFLGGRQLSPTVAAISAGASDMSGWVLLGLPGYAYLAGLEAAWISIGLVIGVAANWLLMAKRLRIYSAQLDDAVTLPAYLQRRFSDPSPWLKSIASVSILLFFLFYVGSGLIAGGKLFNEVFGFDYQIAVFVSVALILLYTLFGGFLAVSWTDVFQGILMLLALVAVPVLVINQSGGMGDFAAQIDLKNPELLNIFTSADGQTLGWMTIISAMGWGLGYFGQPHILARFKALRSPEDTGRAATIGISWALLCYMLAILVGLSGVAFLDEPLVDSEKVFIALTSLIFHPLVAGVLLAAILAAIMSTVDSQLLVCSASLAEDLYPLVAKKPLSQEKRLQVGRIAVVVLALLATSLAMNPDSKVLDVVSYAWAGLGASLGPAVLVSVYWRGMTAWGAMAGVIVGALTVVIWSRLDGGLFDLYALVPGFIFAIIAIVVVSLLSKSKLNPVVVKQFDQMHSQL
ncbi:sodium/proline symporter PutP [Porticoccaceae bacterium]|jgi:sodium/proline symporter|nr:sodium/proline symporter PutP [Porticoccaceae bacterium]MDC1476507.1 sodium/proline symporter PutP [Porticoccaceae bacterium]CAI8307022.1 MAG: High-affinity proline transporter PutP [SAR92 bacterium MED-G29]|tara:strand:+ start:5715 stop:7196 length:1482 start_codon:yes stop_codon:yes gene_type:complete